MEPDPAMREVFPKRTPIEKSRLPYFKPHGFTIIELIVTMAVVAILATIAIPSFIEIMTKRRIAGYVNEFSGALAYARSEAIRRGVPVSVCRSSDGSSCGASWGSGWIVFANTDNDSPAVRDGNETILRAFPALASGFTANTSSTGGKFANDITYDRLGLANDIGTVAFCRNSNESLAGAVDVARTRLRVAKDTNGDGIPNKVVNETSVNITSCENP